MLEPGFYKSHVVGTSSGKLQFNVKDQGITHRLEGPKVMTEKLLAFVDHDGNATILESLGENMKELHSETVGDMAQFPEDLGVYEQAGLVIWEGDVNHDRVKDEYIFTGGWRNLNAEDWTRLGEKRSVFEENE